MSISIYLWKSHCYTEATKCPGLTSCIAIGWKKRTVRNLANQRLCKRVQGLQNSLFSHAILVRENRREETVRSDLHSVQDLLLSVSDSFFRYNTIWSTSEVWLITSSVYWHWVPSKNFPAQGSASCNNPGYQLQLNLWTAGISFFFFFLLLILRRRWDAIWMISCPLASENST